MTIIIKSTTKALKSMTQQNTKLINQLITDQIAKNGELKLGTKRHKLDSIASSVNGFGLIAVSSVKHIS